MHLTQVYHCYPEVMLLFQVFWSFGLIVLFIGIAVDSIGLYGVAQPLSRTLATTNKY